MTNGFQPFLISEFKTGINTYLQPWIRPADAFEPLVNAYVNRGTVNKRSGFTQYGNTISTEKLTITGISKATSAVITAGNNFTGADYGVTTITFSGVVGMTEINGLTGTVTASTSSHFTVNINSTGFTSYVSGGIATFTLLAGRPVMGIMRYVNEATGANSLLIGTTTNLYLYDPGTGNYNPITLPAIFTGNITNFFNYTNWQPTSASDSTIYMVNNKDPVTLWTGSGAATQPTLAVDSSMSPDTITTCLDLKVYKQRLLYIKPTLSSSPIPQNQAIYWSASSNPTDVITDVAGHGGFLEAPTGDIILSARFLRDILVVFFTNSTWIFRYTGNESAPFRWDRVNNSKSTNCPYGSIGYDERCTSIGSTGLIACDGVNVQRYDIPIIDYYETNFSETYFAQTFGQRYDNLNQGWMLYVSNETPFPLVGGVAPGSDSALIFNFVENTFATYKFPIPLTCLGLFYNQTGVTWASLTQAWENTDLTWNSFSSQKGAPILLSGDTTGHVYHMDNEAAVTDNGTSIIPDIVTTRWNPIMQVGQKVQFGYIDIYYYIASVDPTNPVQVTLNFYTDNSENISLVRTLTLDGPTESEFAFKRIYINLVGEFIQMEIDPNVDSFLQFVGFIIWARPAGRLTP